MKDVLPSCALTIILSCSVLGTSLHSSTLRAAGTPGAGGDDLIGAQESAAGAARQYYRAGLESKQTALALEQQAADDEDEREALLERAQAEWQTAATAQGKALKLDLNDHEAANELGFALRKSGRHRKALGAYNFALTIKPDFYPAIEYRGEAYLALGRLEEAKAAYMTLFRSEPELAARLLVAMEGVPVLEETEQAAFQAWVEERKLLAAITPGAVTEAASW